jgi:hypothetical protein
MTLPIDPDLPDQILLDAYAQPSSERSDLWWFAGSPKPHDRSAALAVIRTCLVLGRPVSDVFTAEMLWALVDRVRQLEQRRS